MTLMMAHDNTDCSSGKLTGHEVTMIINKGEQLKFEGLPESINR